jgi:hypothetical protein
MPLIFIILLLFSGCAQCMPEVITVPVKVPIVTPCIVEKIEVPDWYINHLTADADSVAKLKAALADLELSRSYIEELEAELAACS